MQAERERVIGTTEQAAALDMLLSEKLATLEKLPEAVRLPEDDEQLHIIDDLVHSHR